MKMDVILKEYRLLQESIKGTHCFFLLSPDYPLTVFSLYGTVLFSLVGEQSHVPF
jgi:hypothetical protein